MSSESEVPIGATGPAFTIHSLNNYTNVYVPPRYQYLGLPENRPG